MSDALRHQLQSSLGGAYTIARELGGGGMARVFVAERDELLAENFLDPLFDPLRGSARYPAVVQRLGARLSD